MPHIHFNKHTFSLNTLHTPSPRIALYHPLRSEAILASLGTPIPTSTRSSRAPASQMACQLLDSALARKEVEQGSRATRRRWDLRVEHKYNNSSFTRVRMVG